ncbi:HAD-IA family hydrolase [Pseudomonas sp. CBSPBW29]|uniref:HAD-IA family hydrolase n=1 Tax=Pseudomonas TaxID=286 RepID=UPI0021ACAC43|nr:MULTISPECIES: HAD-IA family hydrolase [unclassified Pseudomonas]WEL42036.1 HAD-IA family hydrolase [Pseudomonas sp. CBSPBW29]WEL63097.1 HAD-IA family hydrolase [Pseudomonas sp. CBSPGW29]WEL72285.1 HAD-IA family hydrolase [Pseudomonas sp. CBSPCGW29]WEL79184.1 HAD-IA family hydrolase [Pseudomonas sp. CBSPAW29]WEL82164.1 HAD-IA family hydrolase [Pseudomonas sp. CBSPCAW29]WEL90639.1 HAD-IA family hydrolase [Pseudomonas sp. CBSPCBW29]
MSHLDYKLLIFDWDGTLCNSIGRIVDSMHAASTRAGYALCDDLAVKGIIGLGLPEAIRTLYPEIGDDELIAFRQHYADHYMALDAQPSPLFEGVAQAMEAFRADGYHLAVATGKARRGLDRVLKAHGWENYFDATRAADETASKPHPLMLEQILAQCGVSPRQALMVGDASFDLMMARNAGMDSVAVSYGAQSAEALQAYEPRLTIDRFSELQAWLSRAH